MTDPTDDTAHLDRLVEEQVQRLRRVAARTLRDYADRHHHFGGGGGPTWAGTEPIDPDAWCACGSSWSQDEAGCSERIQLLDDAAKIEAGTLLEPAP